MFCELWDRSWTGFFALYSIGSHCNECNMDVARWYLEFFYGFGKGILHWCDYQTLISLILTAGSFKCKAVRALDTDRQMLENKKIGLQGFQLMVFGIVADVVHLWHLSYMICAAIIFLQCVFVCIILELNLCAHCPTSISAVI